MVDLVLFPVARVIDPRGVLTALAPRWGERDDEE
jgi:hypothetical protein